MEHRCGLGTASKGGVEERGRLIELADFRFSFSVKMNITGVSLVMLRFLVWGSQRQGEN